MSDETSVNTVGLDASPATTARNMPIVRGRCPSCGLESLFLAVGGHVTCASLHCSDPCAATDLLAFRHRAAFWRFQPSYTEKTATKKGTS